MEMKFSFTQTISPQVYGRIEPLLHGDINLMIKFCKYYFEMYLSDAKVVKEYYIIPEIYSLVDHKKPVDQSNLKIARLHFHGIIISNDYNLLCKRIYSLKSKLGFNKLNYIQSPENFQRANDYLFKFQPFNPPIIDWFSTYINRLLPQDRIEIWNHTHKSKIEVIQNVTKDILTYFQ